VRPWVIEERRENPKTFLEEFAKRVDERRNNLTPTEWTDLTLIGLFEFFQPIYRNTLYQQEPWKIAFHLSEELGEAAIELTRLQALCVLDPETLSDELDKIKKRVGRKIDTALRNISDYQRPEFQEDWYAKRDRFFATLGSISSNPESWLHEEWGLEQNAFGNMKAKDLALRLYFAELVTKKFKEELADVASWLVAITYAIGPDGRATGHSLNGPQIVLSHLSVKYRTQRDQIDYLACSWCGEEQCSNGCLIRNTMSDELVQEIIKF